MATFVRVGPELHAQVVEALGSLVRDGVEKPTFSDFSEEYSICGYMTRESICRAMAHPSDPIGFFVPDDFGVTQELLKHFLQSTLVFLGCKIDITVTSGGMEYRPVILIAQKELKDATRRLICTRLNRSINDLQTYTGWGTVGKNTFGEYDPMYLSSTSAKAVCHIQGL